MEEVGLAPAGLLAVAVGIPPALVLNLAESIGSSSRI